MNILDMKIEEIRNEMHELLELHSIASDVVIRKSQELDMLIAEKQLQGGTRYGKTFF